MKNKTCDFRERARNEISCFKEKRTGIIIVGAALCVIGLVFLMFIRSTPLRLVSAAYFGRIPSAIIFWIFCAAAYFVLGVCIAIVAEGRCSSPDSWKCILDMAVVFCLMLIWYPILYSYRMPLLAFIALVAACVFCVFAIICAKRMWVTVTAGLIILLIWLVYLTLMCGCYMLTF